MSHAQITVKICRILESYILIYGIWWVSLFTCWYLIFNDIYFYLTQQISFQHLWRCQQQQLCIVFRLFNFGGGTITFEQVNCVSALWCVSGLCQKLTRLYESPVKTPELAVAVSRDTRYSCAGSPSSSAGDSVRSYGSGNSANTRKRVLAPVQLWFWKSDIYNECNWQML